MANEIIGKKERVILVQTDSQAKERVVYVDSYNGMFQTTEAVSAAKDFKTAEEAQKVADGLNMLYKLMNQKFKVKVVQEVTERTLVGEKKEEKNQESPLPSEDAEAKEHHTTNIFTN